jgi:hypothetical protein
MRASLGVNTRLIEKTTKGSEKQTSKKTRTRFAYRSFVLSAKGEGTELTKHYFVSFFIKRVERGDSIFLS